MIAAFACSTWPTAVIGVAWCALLGFIVWLATR